MSDAFNLINQAIIRAALNAGCRARKDSAHGELNT